MEHRPDNIQVREDSLVIELSYQDPRVLGFYFCRIFSVLLFLCTVGLGILRPDFWWLPLIFIAPATFSHFRLLGLRRLGDFPHLTLERPSRAGSPGKFRLVHRGETIAEREYSWQQLRAVQTHEPSSITYSKLFHRIILTGEGLEALPGGGRIQWDETTIVESLFLATYADYDKAINVLLWLHGELGAPPEHDKGHLGPDLVSWLKPEGHAGSTFAG